MAEDAPIACSLDASDYRARLREMARAGATGLIGRSDAGGRHVLRFRREEALDSRLRSIVAAEAECCPFLDLQLAGEDGELVLTIAGPPDAEPVAAELAAAFGVPR